MTTNKEDGFIEIEGAKVYYQVEGEGEALVLIHAGVADSRMWDGMVATLAEQFRVIRYDLRGFGQSKNMPAKFSNVEDLVQILDHFGVAEAFITGISYGSSIALDFSLKYPERMKKLVMGAPSVAGTPPSATLEEFWEAEEALVEAGDLEAATELNLKLWVDGPQRTPDEVDPAVRQLVHDMQLLAFENETDDEVEVIRYGPPFAYERLAEISVPTLVIVGALDLEGKVALAKELDKKIPKSELQIIDGAAHMVSMEKPGEFLGAMIDFLLNNVLA